MPVELMHLMQLAYGQLPSLPVGDLPRPVAEHYGCHPAIVYLGSKVLRKIVGTHSDITQTEIQLLPQMLRHGAYYTHPSRQNCCNLFCKHPETGKLYLVGLKATDNGHEVWVEAVYRTDAKKAESKQRRGKRIWGFGR